MDDHDWQVLARYDVVLKRAIELAASLAHHGDDCCSCDTYGQVLANGRAVQILAADDLGDQALMLTRPMQDAFVILTYLTLHPEAVGAFRDFRRIRFALQRQKDGSQDPLLQDSIDEVRAKHGWCIGQEQGWTFKYLRDRPCPHGPDRPTHRCQVTMAILEQEASYGSADLANYLRHNFRRSSGKLHTDPRSVTPAGMPSIGPVVPLETAALIMAFAAHEIVEFHRFPRACTAIVNAIDEAAALLA